MRNRIPELFVGILLAGLLLLGEAGIFLYPAEVQARGRKVSHSGHKTSHKSSTSARTRVSGRSSRSSRPASRHSGKHSKKSRKSHAVHKAAHFHQPRAHHPASVEAQAEAPKDLNAEPRARNYALLSRGYALYDQGINERLKGNYGAAVDKLSQASNLFDQARSHQHNGQPSTLEAMTFYELGQAAEADGDFTLARDSYARSLRARPGFPEGYLHIANLLCNQGNLPLAMQWLKDGLNECPNDVRLNEMVTRLSVFSGENSD